MLSFSNKVSAVIIGSQEGFYSHLQNPEKYKCGVKGSIRVSNLAKLLQSMKGLV